jgi:hypothetical protein
MFRTGAQLPLRVRELRFLSDLRGTADRPPGRVLISLMKTAPEFELTGLRRPDALAQSEGIYRLPQARSKARHWVPLVRRGDCPGGGGWRIGTMKGQPFCLLGCRDHALIRHTCGRVGKSCVPATSSPRASLVYEQRPQRATAHSNSFASAALRMTASKWNWWARAGRPSKAVLHHPAATHPQFRPAHEFLQAQSMPKRNHLLPWSRRRQASGPTRPKLPMEGVFS